jgi:hypothetical protein
MNVLKQTIYTELAAAEAATAAMAEGAIDLPQGTACQRVISCDGRVTQLSSEAVKGALALEGLVEFSVVFEDSHGSLDSIAGVCPFTHRLSTPQAEPGMEAKVVSTVSSPSARAAGGSRLLVSAVVEIEAAVYGMQPVEVVHDADDARLQMLKQKVYWFNRSAIGKASVTVREEVEVPKDLPEVAKVLMSRGDIRISDVQPLSGEAMVAGDLQLSVIYADAAGNINRGVFSVPFGAPVQAGGMLEKMEARAWGSVSQLFINVGENLSDERRVLSLEAPLFLSIEGYEPCEMEALQDAYHLDCDIGMAREDIGLFDGPVEVSEKVKVKGSLPRSDALDADSTLQLAEVSPVIDNYSVSEGRIDLSGRLITRVFSRAADDKLASVLVEAPYTTEILWEGASPDSLVELSVLAAKSSASVGSENFDVDAELEVTVTSRRLLNYSVLTELEQGEQLSRALAPLTLCVAGPGDTAWTLARRCRVKVEDLVRTNPEIARGVTPGAKLVILRK